MDRKMSYSPIREDEEEIVGHRIVRDGTVDGDEATKRINYLITEKLTRFASSGWETVFVDPNDGRYWLLYYPQSELHGGGPPALKHISEAEAKARQ